MSEEGGFRERNLEMLREGQAALNVAFSAILSAYVGNSLAEIDNAPFDHGALARFFVAVAVFILGLILGNSLLLRGEHRLATFLLVAGLIGAAFAHEAGRKLGFETSILRLLAITWFVALLASNALLTFIHYLHHRNRK